MSENQSHLFFDCEPGEIVEIAAEELADATAATGEPKVVRLVAKTRTPWLSTILYGGLVAMFGIGCFLAGLQSGVKICQSTYCHQGGHR